MDDADDASALATASSSRWISARMRSASGATLHPPNAIERAQRVAQLTVRKQRSRARDIDLGRRRHGQRRRQRRLS